VWSVGPSNYPARNQTQENTMNKTRKVARKYDELRAEHEVVRQFNRRTRGHNRRRRDARREAEARQGRLAVVGSGLGWATKAQLDKLFTEPDLPKPHFFVDPVTGETKQIIAVKDEEGTVIGSAEVDATVVHTSETTEERGKAVFVDYHGVTGLLGEGVVIIPESNFPQEHAAETVVDEPPVPGRPEIDAHQAEPTPSDDEIRGQEAQGVLDELVLLNPFTADAFAVAQAVHYTDVDYLEGLNRDQLRGIAKAIEVPGRGRITRKAIVGAIKAHAAEIVDAG
jgi:hypothetical protein